MNQHTAVVTGEPNNPYQIATKADLLSLGTAAVHYGKSFILTADIDLDAVSSGWSNLRKGNYRGDTNPVSEFQGTKFTGTFDGRGHMISNLSISGGQFLGLFGYTGSGALLKNIVLEDCSISGSDCVGGLVGQNDYGTITQCRCTVANSGNQNVGGLVGSNVSGAHHWL